MGIMTDNITTIYRERITPTDPRLKRSVHHDSRSRRYPFRTDGLVLTSVRHTRAGAIFDQGNIGACTAMAGVGCLLTGSFSAHPAAYYERAVAGAFALYSDATLEDPFPGSWPPDDTGSDGLTIAKVLTRRGEISGYQHTFSLEDALKALTVTPFITGTNWSENMFTFRSDGRVVPGGPVVGGHEYIADELDVQNQRIWFTNSWGTGWGAGGRFWMSWVDYGNLLAQRGDVTIFVPNTLPAPQPEPVEPQESDPHDSELWLQVKDWANSRGLCGPTSKAKAAVRKWAATKDLQ